MGKLDRSAVGTYRGLLVSGVVSAQAVNATLKFICRSLKS